MYAELADLFRRPEPFSVYTTDRLWTDPHVAKRMLAFHLDGDNDLASRRTASIEAIVGWIDARFDLSGKAVTDLGCGPGLYAIRYAGRGAAVTGLDFSETSLAHARAASASVGLAIDYRKADYHRDAFPSGQDLVTLIYGDYCAMSKARRRSLVTRVREALRPGGTFLFDVFSLAHFAALGEGHEFARRLMGGFWAAGDYFGYRVSFKYAEEAIGLDRYLIVEPDRRTEIYNWMQYFSPASIVAELRAFGGFSSIETVDVLSGGPVADDATQFAVIARP